MLQNIRIEKKQKAVASVVTGQGLGLSEQQGIEEGKPERKKLQKGQH